MSKLSERISAIRDEMQLEADRAAQARMVEQQRNDRRRVIRWATTQSFIPDSELVLTEVDGSSWVIIRHVEDFNEHVVCTPAGDLFRVARACPHCGESLWSYRIYNFLDIFSAEADLDTHKPEGVCPKLCEQQGVVFGYTLPED